MASEQSFWFRVGYALERAINPTTTAGERFSNLGTQSQKKATSDVPQPSVKWPLPDQVVPTALVAAASEAGRLLMVAQVLPFFPEFLHGDESLADEYAQGAAASAQYFNRRKLSIYGGANEIQKSIVAKTILGM